MNSQRSKTHKNKSNKKDKKHLWEQFENATKDLECVYSSEKDEQYTEICTCCNDRLALSEDGLMTCTNKKCGIFIKI